MAIRAFPCFDRLPFDTGRRDPVVNAGIDPLILLACLLFDQGLPLYLFLTVQALRAFPCCAQGFPLFRPSIVSRSTVSRSIVSRSIVHGRP
jgi:hypothetical protein